MQIGPFVFQRFSHLGFGLRGVHPEQLRGDAGPDRQQLQLQRPQEPPDQVQHVPAVRQPHRVRDEVSRNISIQTKQLWVLAQQSNSCFVI